jgi:hypothetical protein
MHGKPFPTAFDAREAHTMKEVRDIPYWKRRQLSYVLGWSNDIFRSPYWPSGVQPTSHLFPVLIASTFADYYGYHFAVPEGFQQKGPPGRRLHAFSRASVMGGAVIAMVTLLAWMVAIRSVWKRRRYGELALLFAPLVVLLAQIDMSIRYPIDWLGPVKGNYMQLVAPVWCGLFGLAVAWLWEKRRWYSRAACVLALASVAPVAAYTIAARIEAAHTQKYAYMTSSAQANAATHTAATSGAPSREESARSFSEGENRRASQLSPIALKRNSGTM